MSDTKLCCHGDRTEVKLRGASEGKTPIRKEFSRETIR